MGNSIETEEVEVSKVPISASKQNIKENIIQDETKKIKTKAKTVKMKGQNMLKVHNITNSDLIAAVPLNEKEEERLCIHFKHLCSLAYNFPKNVIFEHLKDLYGTINQTEWMIYCRQLGITEKFKQINDGLKLLSIIFKKYENTEKRINRKGFIMAMRGVIYYQLLQIQKENRDEQGKQQIREQALKQIINDFCLDSKANHVNKLKEMGIICPPQSYGLSKNPIENQNDNKQNQNQQRTVDRKSTKSTPLQSNRLPKIYNENKSQKNIQRGNQQRHKASIKKKNDSLSQRISMSSITKQICPDDIKKTFGKFVNDDEFLKEYLDKHEKTKEGIVNRLDNRVKKLNSHSRI